MNNLTQINFHGHLGEAIGERWTLSVSSIREAIHAINILTHGKLYDYLLKKNKDGAQYKIMVNDNYLKGSLIEAENADKVSETELVMDINHLEKIDIVPLIEGADKNVMGGLLIVIGVVLVIVGILTSPFLVGAGLVIAGLTLIYGGISILLSKPPSFARFDNIPQGSAGRSYFFGGAINITTEGGPVPLGYGEAVVGSQVISAGYSVGIRADSLPRPNSNSPNVPAGPGNLPIVGYYPVVGDHPGIHQGELP